MGLRNLLLWGGFHALHRISKWRCRHDPVGRSALSSSSVRNTNVTCAGTEARGHRAAAEAFLGAPCRSVGEQPPCHASHQWQQPCTGLQKRPHQRSYRDTSGTGSCHEKLGGEQLRAGRTNRPLPMSMLPFCCDRINISSNFLPCPEDSCSPTWRLTVRAVWMTGCCLFAGRQRIADGSERRGLSAAGSVQ